MIRLNSVPESYVPTGEVREARALVRERQTLVENRTKYANRIHGLLSDHGITEDVKPLTKERREFPQELSLPTPWDALLESYLEMIETLTEEIQKLEETIEERAGSLKETQLLMTIPGVSHYTALTIYAELGEISRFDGDKEVVSYVGLNPVIRESGDSRIEGSISKRGSGRVQWLLVQAAHNAVHVCNDEYLSRFYERLASRKNSQKAIVATARKMLISIYHMLDRGEPYDPPDMSTERRELRATGAAALSGRPRPSKNDCFRQTATAPHHDGDRISAGRTADTKTAQLFCRKRWCLCR